MNIPNMPNVPNMDIPASPPSPPTPPVPDFDAQLDKIVHDQQVYIYTICFCVCVAIAGIAAAFVYFKKKQLGGNSPAASTIMKKAALQSMAITMLLKSHRYVAKGITDDKMFAGDAANNSAAGGTNPFALKQEDEMFTNASRIPSYNLAIIIGVDSQETPAASEDAAKLKEALEADGSYHVAFFSSRGFRPSSTNLASVVKQIQDANRPWRSVIVFIASKLRLAPAEWVDVRKMLRGIGDPKELLKQDAESPTAKGPTPEEEGRVKFVSQRHQPKFLLEFMTDESAAQDEATWVDIGMFLKRLRHATTVSGNTTNPITLMLDSKYDSEGVKESVAFMDAASEDPASKATSAAGGDAKTATFSTFNSEPALRIPDPLMAYLGSLNLETAVERLLCYHQLECVAFGGNRVIPSEIEVKVKKSKSIPLGAATGKSLTLDGQTSMFVRAFLEGMDTATSSNSDKIARGTTLDNLQVNWEALQKNAGASSGSVAVPVSTTNTASSIYHRCTASPASILHYMRNKGFSTKDGNKDVVTTKWHNSLFSVTGTTITVTSDFNHGILEQSSLMPNRVPPSPLAEWKVPRAEAHEKIINSIADKSNEWKPLHWINLHGPHGSGKSTLVKSLSWQPSLLRGFSTGVVWIDMNDFAVNRHALKGTLPVGCAEAGIGKDLITARSVFVEIVDVLAMHFWPVLGGVNSFEVASSIWSKLITGSNSVVVFDHVDRENPLHEEVFAHVSLSAREERPPKGTTYPESQEPPCGLFTAVVITIQSQVEDKAENIVLDGDSIGPDNCETLIRDVTGEADGDDELGLSPKALADFCSSVACGNLWVTKLVAGIAGKLQDTVAKVDANSAKQHSKTLVEAIAAYHSSSQGEEETTTFINELVDLAIAVAAKISNDSIGFEEVANILRQHMVATLITGSVGVPLAALKFYIASYYERMILPALVDLGIFANLESQRPRRVPLSRQQVVTLHLNPVVYRSHINKQQLLPGALAGVQSALESVTWPPLFHNHSIPVFIRDSTVHCTAAIVSQMAGSRKRLVPNINDKNQLIAAFGGNFSYLRSLATRVTSDGALMALLSNGAQTILPASVEKALKQLFTDCPRRPKGLLDHELFAQLFLRIDKHDAAHKMFFGSVKNIGQKQTDETEKTPVTEATQESCFPHPAGDFNNFVIQELQYEIPVSKRRKMRFMANDDSDEETEEDDDDEQGTITADMLSLQPNFNEFSLLVLGKDEVRSTVTTSCFAEGSLFIGFLDGHLEKRDPSTGEIVVTKSTGHGGRISNIVAFPPDGENKEWRLCTASFDTKTIIMWKDLDLSDSEKVSTVAPPIDKDPKYGEQIVTAKLQAQLVEAGANVTLRQQEQLQYHRDIDAERFRSLYGNGAGPDSFFEPGLRRRLEKERKATTVLVSFDSPEHGDSLAWNQLEVFGKLPEEVTGAAAITLGSEANPLTHCNIGTGPDGAARLFVTDLNGTLYFFRVVSLGVCDIPTAVKRSPKPPAYKERTVWVPSNADDTAPQQKATDAASPVSPLVDLSSK